MTISKRKYDLLVEELIRLEKEVYDCHLREKVRRLNESDEVWYWQGDGEDYLESIVCPIVILPHQLEEILNNPSQEAGVKLTTDH